MPMVQDDLPTLPDCIPTTKAGFSTKIGLMVLSVLGWKIVGEICAAGWKIVGDTKDVQ